MYYLCTKKSVTGIESTMTFQDDQLCAILKAGIDGSVHRVQDIWDENLTTEDWGFLLVDAKNAFNDIDRVEMMCKVRHVWPSGSHSFFNFYCH